ncbi:expressed unknown protein [Seminavis robusta]|uniref:Glycosyltransferase family 92 protein n=1 Tax=Seminavis robusta TaxID=568900 RepID=A0A9N8ELY6_9STRA|nr:expressed unknown protein [Seminavis robusta]|eukprot:Sro1307_g261320.1 n/a (539) ;mRNA; r:8551-10167
MQDRSYRRHQAQINNNSNNSNDTPQLEHEQIRHISSWRDNRKHPPHTGVSIKGLRYAVAVLGLMVACLQAKSMVSLYHLSNANDRNKKNSRVDAGRQLQFDPASIRMDIAAQVEAQLLEANNNGQEALAIVQGGEEELGEDDEIPMSNNNNTNGTFVEDDDEVEESEDEDEEEEDEPVHFVNVPPPPRNLTSKDIFGACLLIKDDNHWLIEWLAYHYHVLPLRYLIVAVDPTSKTTPQHILDRWLFHIKIQVWKDDDFVTRIPKFMRKLYHNNTQVLFHRHRQNSFYIKCMQELKRKGKVPWVQLTDTDEFTALNYASGPLYNLTKYHPIQTPGSILSFLLHHQYVTNGTASSKCIYMPRYIFGTHDTPRKGLVNRNVPKNNPILRGHDFVTQRFMFRQPTSMNNGKNLVHLEAIPMHILQQAQLGRMNVHRVSNTCPTQESFQGVNHVKRTMIKIHHYLGTQEQYLFRSDPRTKNNTMSQEKVAFNPRGLERYQRLDREAVYSDSGARGWISGFIQDVGLPTAEYLLKGVGQVGVEK